MTPAAALARDDRTVLLDREGRIRVAVDEDDRPVAVTLDGREGLLAPLQNETGELPPGNPDVIVASVELKLRAAIELRRLTGNPVVLVDQLGRLAGLCGDEEIYRGLLHRQPAAEDAR
jgi:glycine betaine/proline transport system ATP-binding protein